MSALVSPLKSPVLFICQLGPGLNEPTAPADVTLVPSISQIAGVPSWPCQRMSLFTSSLKSPVPLICQLGPGLNEPAAPVDTTFVPSISQIAGMAVVALPEEIATAVRVEVAGALDMPARSRIGPDCAVER